MDQVRDHLKDYLDRSCHIVSGKQANIDQDLHLLIIQCFEVYFVIFIIIYFLAIMLTTPVYTIGFFGKKIFFTVFAC